MLLTRQEFFTIFSLAMYRYFYEDVDPSRRVRDITEIRGSYDFVVVGAGAAGSVLGRRLTENGSWTVLVLEAGGPENYLTDAPFLGLFNDYGDRSWVYNTTYQQYACQAYGCVYAMGRGMGGSSTVGVSLYSRGNPMDYDRWSEMSNSSQWSYRNVEKYFRKLENVSRTDLSSERGRDGPQSVEYPWYSAPISQFFIRAAQEIGFDLIDVNGRNQIGISRGQLYLDGSIRASASTSYLDPVRNRPNLNVAMYSEVTRFEFDPNYRQVRGVYFTRNGRSYYVEADKEVIVSAGALNTPKLLMLNGIGPKEHLESLGIQVVKNLPVGDNLQDHIAANSFFSINESIAISDREVFTNESIFEYAVNRSGPLTSTGVEAFSFVNVFDYKNPLPNMEIVFYSDYGFTRNTQPDPSRPNLIGAVFDLLNPESRGTVRLSSSDPSDPPIINPNFLSTEKDRETFILGIKIFLKMMSGPVMERLSPQVNYGYSPTCSIYGIEDERYPECLMLRYTNPDFHPAGTCRMGSSNDLSAVVDPNLLILGFDNLRVVDASIMPLIPSGNTYGPTLMVAEVASDIIKARWTSM